MKIKIKKWRYISIIRITYVILVCLAFYRATRFHVTRLDNMDLARHFYMMELIKKSDYSFIEYVFIHGDAFTSNITMKFCYVFNIFIYLTAKYSQNYYMLAWFFIIIDYSIIAYIGIDWWKNQKGRNVYMALFEVMICFSLLPFIHAVSGLRTAAAACATALAIYLYIYKNVRFSVYIILNIVAITIHPAFILSIPFVFLAKRFERKTGSIIAVLGSLAISITANVFIKSTNKFLYSIAYKYLQYTGEGGYRSTRFCYYGVIVIGIIVILLYYNNFYKFTEIKEVDDITKKNNKRKEEVLYDFIAYYAFYILSNIGAYEMVVRPAYLLGAMAPLVTGMVFGIEKAEMKRKDIKSICFQMMLFVIIAYVSVMYLIWHREYFL